MRRLIQLAIVAGVLAGLWLLLRELLSEHEGTGQAERRTESSPPRTAAPASSGNGAVNVTKAELYEEAQALDVEGRSKMSKDELAEAVAAARRATRGS